MFGCNGPDEGIFAPGGHRNIEEFGKMTATCDKGATALRYVTSK